MKSTGRPTVTICSSANFYRHVLDIQEELKSLGYDVIVPQTALRMKQSGDFDASHYKTWFGNADDYNKKAKLMTDHFNEVSRGDITLVINNEKHGAPNYIGGNVLMEMAIAFYLGKPIYLYNEIGRAHV